MVADKVLYLSAAFHNPPKDICHDANIQQVLLGHYLYCRCCSFADSCHSETVYRRLLQPVSADRCDESRFVLKSTYMPSLWRTVIFDLSCCKFLKSVDRIEIAFKLHIFIDEKYVIYRQ